jgi:hypothetical protein
MHIKLAQIEFELEEIGNLIIILPKDYVLSRKKAKLNLKELIEIDFKLSYLKDFYAFQLYESFRTCVVESLRSLAEGCGYQIDMIENVIDDIELFSNEKNDSNVDVIEFLRIRSTENSSIHSRPVSVASAISKATWTIERKMESAFLK